MGYRVHFPERHANRQVADLEITAPSGPDGCADRAGCSAVTFEFENVRHHGPGCCRVTPVRPDGMICI
jgi:hypothetical protein